jgi:hypothetical protein
VVSVNNPSKISAECSWSMACSSEREKNVNREFNIVTVHTQDSRGWCHEGNVNEEILNPPHAVSRLEVGAGLCGFQMKFEIVFLECEARVTVTFVVNEKAPPKKWS